MKLGLGESEFWDMTPRVLFSLIDQNRIDQKELAILGGYANRMEDPSRLRDTKKVLSSDSAWDSLG